jgi:hypothetical protein
MGIRMLSAFAGRPTRVIVHGCDWVWLEYRPRLREWDVYIVDLKKSPWPIHVWRTNDLLEAVGKMLWRVRHARA